MSKDISKILQGWDYAPDELMVRVVEGDDGREKIQLRLDMGVLQMELSGRPDGQRPGGCESCLELYEQKQREHEQQGPDTVPFELSDEDCESLWREGVQYYHRYLSCWHLKRYDLVARDTARNLRLFAFARRYASGERNKFQFDQWRPYVTMMHTRAVATPCLEEGKYRQALKMVDSGIDAIGDFLDEYQQSHRAKECVELVNLERWRDEILMEMRQNSGADPEEVAEALRRRLQEAVTAEDFEEAARLRDEIRRLGSDH